MAAFNVVFTVFSGIGFVISVIPLWWHVQSWDMHVGTCMYMVWTALGCLVHFVDSIVWNGNAINWAPVWCDISSHIQLAVAVAWPACGLWITRRLYNISVGSTPAHKGREMIIGLLITVGIPVLQMVAQYVVAGHRFNIFEDYGCGPATWDTPLAYVLVYSWPLIIALISACYGALAIRALLKNRREIRGLITTETDPTFNPRRLIALASLDFFFTIPMATWGIVGNSLWGGVSPWVSWSDTHWGYSRVFQYPRVLIEQKPVIVCSLETTRWAAVLCAFVFFALFGFVDEAKENYRLLGSTLTKIFRCTKDPAVAASGVDFPLQFRATDTEKSTGGCDSFLDKRSTLTSCSEFYPEPRTRSRSLDVRSHLSGSSRLSVTKVPRVPEPIFDPLSIRPTSDPDAFERV